MILKSNSEKEKDRIMTNTPYRCPVCNGRTTVHNSLYSNNTTDDSEVLCKTCHGKGYITS